MAECQCTLGAERPLMSSFWDSMHSHSLALVGSAWSGGFCVYPCDILCHVYPGTVGVAGLVLVYEEMSSSS